MEQSKHASNFWPLRREALHVLRTGRETTIANVAAITGLRAGQDENLGQVCGQQTIPQVAAADASRFMSLTSVIQEAAAPCARTGFARLALAKHFLKSQVEQCVLDLKSVTCSS